MKEFNFTYERMQVIFNNVTKKDEQIMHDFLNGSDDSIPDDRWLIRQILNYKELFKDLFDYIKKVEIDQEKQPALYEILRSDSNKINSIYWDHTSFNIEERDLFYAIVEFFRITAKPNNNIDRQKQTYLKRCGFLRWFFRLTLSEDPKATLDTDQQGSLRVISSELPISQILSLFKINHEEIIEKTWGDMQFMLASFTNVMSLRRPFFVVNIPTQINKYPKHTYMDFYYFINVHDQSRTIRNIMSHDNKEYDFPEKYKVSQWSQIVKYLLFYYIGLIVLLKKAWATLNNNEEMIKLFLDDNKADHNQYIYKKTPLYKNIKRTVNNTYNKYKNSHNGGDFNQFLKNEINENNSLKLLRNILTICGKKTDDIARAVGTEKKINTFTDDLVKSFFNYLNYIVEHKYIPSKSKYPISYYLEFENIQGIEKIIVPSVPDSIFKFNEHTNPKNLRYGPFPAYYYNRFFIEYHYKNATKVIKQPVEFTWEHKDNVTVKADPVFLLRSYKNSDEQSIATTASPIDIDNPTVQEKETSTPPKNNRALFQAEVNGVKCEFEVINPQAPGTKQKEQTGGDLLSCSLIHFTDENKKIKITIPQTVVSKDGLEFTVSKIGSSAFEGCQISQVIIADSVKEIEYRAFADCTRLKKCEIGQECEIIGEQAFFNCTQLEGIVLLNNLKEIGKEAFRGCTSLEQATLPSSLVIINEAAFKDCSQLKKLTMKNGIQIIGNDVFYGCSALASIHIPESVTSFGAFAFAGCSSLASFTIPKSVTSIEQGTFMDCSSLVTVTLHEGLTTIGHSAFLACSALNSITGPNNVKSIGAMAFSQCKNIKAIYLPTNLKKIESLTFEGCSALELIHIPKSVTTIEYGAFMNCSSLASVTLPDSITDIGPYTFADCSALEKISIPNNVKTIGNRAFLHCSSLTSVSLPLCLTTIDEYTFYGCSALTAINIPENVTEIGQGAFLGCASLNSINIPNSVRTIGEGAFISCSSLSDISIPESVNEIGNLAFYSCSALTSIKIPKSVTNIGNNIFDRCDNLNKLELHCKNISPWHKWATSAETIIIGKEVEVIDENFFYAFPTLKSVELHCKNIGQSWFLGNDSLQDVTIGDEVTRIEDFAFYNCSSLTSIDLPDSVKSIGGHAFSECSSLASISLPNKLERICNHVFYNCSNLTSINIPDSVITIGQWAFAHCSNLSIIKLPGNLTHIGFHAFLDCTSIQAITIPKNIAEINDSAFQGCAGVTSVVCHSKELGFWINNLSSLSEFTIGNEVTRIENRAFAHCSNLKSVKIPNSVTSIGEEAFWNCFDLTSITIPDSVTAIEEKAFYGCKSLTSVTIPDSITKIGKEVFSNCYDLRMVHIGEKCEIIEPEAFGDCYYLKEIRFSNISALKKIDERAFASCYSLDKIIICDNIDRNKFIKKNIPKFIKEYGDSIQIADNAFDENVRKGNIQDKLNKLFYDSEYKSNHTASD